MALSKNCTLADILAAIIARLGRKFDAVLLFTGPEGTGKSWTAMVILAALAKRLNRSFDEKRVHFTGPAFRADAKALPKKSVLLYDESDLMKRAATTKETKAMLKFLQENRALQHVMALCFPHVSLFDSAVKQTRVYLRFHVAKRERDRVKVLVFRPGAKSIHAASKDVWWDLLTWFWLPMPRLPFAAAYEAKKEAHMRSPDEAEAAALVDLDALGL